MLRQVAPCALYQNTTWRSVSISQRPLAYSLQRKCSQRTSATKHRVHQITPSNLRTECKAKDSTPKTTNDKSAASKWSETLSLSLLPLVAEKVEQGEDECEEAPAVEGLSEVFLCTALLALLPADPANAALFNDVPEWAQNFFGVAYLLFFGFFVVRLFGKRAKFATSTKLAGEKDEAKRAEKLAKQEEYAKKPPSAIDSFGGAALAFLLANIFYQASVKIDSSFSSKALPDSYSIAQITITIRTIVSGLAYLATFVFGANATGLLLFGIQALMGGPQEPEEQKKEEPEIVVDDNEPTTVEAYLSQKKAEMAKENERQEKRKEMEAADALKAEKEDSDTEEEAEMVTEQKKEKTALELFMEQKAKDEDEAKLRELAKTNVEAYKLLKEREEREELMKGPK